MMNLIKKICSGKGFGRRNSALVIEDNVIDQLFVQRVLRKNFFDVYLAKDGRTGIHLARQLNPDVIILDCMLPDMHGIQVCRTLKEDPDVKHIPIVFLTVVEDGYNLLQCYDAGANAYLTKPVSAKELIIEIQTAIRDGSEDVSRFLEESH